MHSKRIIILDTETTGLNHRNGDRIVEVACLELEKGLYPTGPSIHYYINPENQSVAAKAFEIHGLHNEFLKDKPIFSESAEELWDFISDAVLVIHNAEFDIQFLNSEFGRLGYPKITSDHVVDTLKIARKKFPGIANNLDALCKRFNISLEERRKHGALVDVQLLASVYVELVHGGRQQSLLSEVHNDASYIQQTVLIKRKTCEPRRFDSVSEEQHREFILKHLKNNAWGY